MKSISGKDFARLLQHKGWHLAHINGSHHIFSKPGHREHITVPVHGNRSLGPGMLRHFLKVSGIKENEL